VKLIAVNDALYHHPGQRDLQDIVTCIREHVSLKQAGTRLQANAERHLKPPPEMRRLFRDCPDAVEETLRFAGRISFTLTSWAGVTRERYRAARPRPASARPDRGGSERYPGTCRFRG
jgi:DNA polymerase III alpha subunit